MSRSTIEADETDRTQPDRPSESDAREPDDRTPVPGRKASLVLRWSAVAFALCVPGFVWLDYQGAIEQERHLRQVNVRKLRDLTGEQKRWSKQRLRVLLDKARCASRLLDARDNGLPALAILVNGLHELPRPWLRSPSFEPPGDFAKVLIRALRQPHVRAIRSQMRFEAAEVSPLGDRILASHFPDYLVGDLLVKPPWESSILRLWIVETGQSIPLLEPRLGLFVQDIRFSPDGRHVAAISDRTPNWGCRHCRDIEVITAVRVWSAATGSRLYELKGHTGTVSTIRFSPDGKRILTAGADRTSRIWDAATGNPLRVLKGHRKSVHSARFSPDGKRIVTASEDKTARIWDSATGRPLRVLSGHGNDVLSARFSPKGKWVVTASKDKTARVWDATTGALIHVLRGHKDEVVDARFFPRGERVLTQGRLEARAWSAATGRFVCAYHQSVASSPQTSA